MRKSKLKVNLAVLLMIGLALPWAAAAQEQLGSAPQTVEEAKGFAMQVLSRLPEAIKRIWEGEALPVWRGMWDWFTGFWQNSIGPIVGPWLNKEIKQRKPEIEQQFQEEKEEMQEDLWQRFKDLLRQ